MPQEKITLQGKTLKIGQSTIQEKVEDLILLSQVSKTPKWLLPSHPLPQIPASGNLPQLVSTPHLPPQKPTHFPPNFPDDQIPWKSPIFTNKS